MHNDSGDGPKLYSMDFGGVLRQTLSLSGVSPRDWEDLAIGPGPEAGKAYLYAGDIGDNHLARSSISVYRVREPAPGSGNIITESFDTMTLAYPDGRHNAETLLVDPWDGSLLIVTKEYGRTAQLFSTGTFGSGSHSRVLQHRGQAKISEIATGGDVSPDGRAVVVRGYGKVHGWTRPPGEPLWTALASSRCSLISAGEAQGETIAFAADGGSYLTISEGKNPPINRFALR